MNDETDNVHTLPKNSSEYDKKTILILGVSSFIGSNLAEFFKDEYKVVGTYHKNPISISGVLTVPCDVLNKDEVQLIVYAFKPDITIYCVGLSSVYDCNESPELAEALNTSGLFNAAEFCQRYKSQICYLSSNFVFAGEDKNYIEMDIPDSSTVYGKTQASTEFYLQKTSLNYVIFRCCRFYGRGINPTRETWFETMQRKLLERETSSFDNFFKQGFLDIYYLGMILKMAFKKEVKNRLFQICSQDIVSYLDVAKTYAKVFSEPEDLIVKGKWSFPRMKEGTTYVENPKYLLDVTNIEGFLNIELPTVEDSLKFTYSRFNGSNQKGKKVKKSGVKFI